MINTVLFYAVSIAGSIYIIQSMLFWLSIWQNSSFSLSQFLRLVFSAKFIKTSIVNILNVAYYLLFVLYFATILDLEFTRKYSYFVAGFMGIFIILFFRNIWMKKVILPYFNIRIFFVFLITFAVEFIIALFPILDPFFWIIFVAKLTPFVLFFVVIITNIPMNFYRDFLFLKVYRKLNHFKKLTVVAILRDTSDSLYNQILYNLFSQIYHVVHSRNDGNATDIAKTILKYVKKQTQIVILDIKPIEQDEMIEIGNLLKPSIGIVAETTYSKHENYIKRNTELFISLFLKNKIVYSKIQNAAYSQIIEGINIKKGKNSQSIQVKKMTMHRNYSTVEIVKNSAFIGRFKTPYLSEAFIAPILTAIAIAQKMGLSINHMKQIIESTKPINGIMEPIRADFITIIDNSRSKDLFLGVSYFSHLRGSIRKKYIYLAPSQQDSSQELYYKLGKEYGKYTDEFFSSGNIYHSFKNEISNACNTASVTVVEKPFDYFKEKLKRGDVLLLLGKGSSQLAQKMKASADVRRFQK